MCIFFWPGCVYIRSKGYGLEFTRLIFGIVGKQLPGQIESKRECQLCVCNDFFFFKLSITQIRIVNHM